MTLRTTSGRLAATLTLFGALLLASTAGAVPSITFDQTAPGGIIAYPVAGGVLVGQEIVFQTFLAEGTGADGLYDCTTCRLNFVSGPNISPGPGAYTWGGGGFFVMTGGSLLAGVDPGYTDPTCDDDGDDSDCTATTVLLSGTFTSNPLNTGVGGLGEGTSFGFLSFGVDTKNPDLAASLGIDPLLWTFSESNFSLGVVNINLDGTFIAPVTQADLQNKKAAPEPGSALLLLLGLGSLAAYRRRS